MQTDRVGEHWHVVKHFYSSLRSQNEELGNLLVADVQPLTKQQNESDLMREKYTFISNLLGTAISLRPLYVFRTCTGRPGCFPGAWSSWIFASRQFAPKIVNASVRFSRLLF